MMVLEDNRVRGRRALWHNKCLCISSGEESALTQNCTRRDVCALNPVMIALPKSNSGDVAEGLSH